jgi:8-oxo-dGTP pyrophosphatase MutT (NUDIX family)
LVLIRGHGGSAEVLLGRRHPEVRFMPGYYVFPGGRLSRADRSPSGFAESLMAAPEGIDQATRRDLVVFARAALRETFEETGLLLTDRRVGPETARVDPGPKPAALWEAFGHAGLAPGFCRLRLIARALTPIGSPMRFHTRFFRAEGEYLYGRLGGDGELHDLAWVPVKEASRLPISEVTLLVLEEALARGRGARRATGRAAGRTRPAPFFRWVGPTERLYSRAVSSRRQA